jgi:para-nitrobenzyl esterase
MNRVLGRMEGRAGFSIAAALLLATWCFVVGLGQTHTSAQAACFVIISDGPVQGTSLGAACSFLGIPYAGSTANENRWRPPQLAAPWTSVLNAVTPANCPTISFFGPTPSIGGDEDCLKLNIWTRNPLPASPAPVIVWLHTGAFTGASGNFAGHRGQALAAETGAIVVAPNYRLGPFGFLAHSALAAEDSAGSTGNYGLLDQQAALRWVRDNIAQFGGDPNNVTIAGTSAGGQSVGLQLVSPGSHGLFHRAIVQSAYPTSRWTDALEAGEQGGAFETALGCSGSPDVLSCMRSASLEAVLTALSQASQQVGEPPGRTFWEPSVDGVVVPDQPRALFESGAFHRVPTIVGFTRDEGWGSFITRSFGSGVSRAQYEGWVHSEFGSYASAVLGLYAEQAAQSPIEAMARIVGDVQFVCEGRRLARLIERTGTPTFLYSYEYEIDTLSLDHVVHGVEGNILFRNNYGPPLFVVHVLTPTDVALHDAMAGYWTRFAATGSPNRGTDTAFSWAPFTHPSGAGRGADNYLILDANIREGSRPREFQCNFFEPFFFRSVLAGLPAAAQ